MGPLDDIVAEADRVLTAAQSQHVPVRLLGGLAVRKQAHELHPAVRRTYADIDLATAKGHGGAVRELLDELGYVGNREFNAVNGARRLLYEDRTAAS